MAVGSTPGAPPRATRDGLGCLILVAPVVGLVLSRFAPSRHLPGLVNYYAPVVGVVVFSGVVAALDAARLKRTRSQSPQTGSAIMWFLLVTLLCPVAFPVYLYHRTQRYRKTVLVAALIMELVTGFLVFDTYGLGEWGQKEKSARLDARAIANAIDLYQIKHGQLPDSLEALLPNEIRDIRGDPWGDPYIYVVIGPKDYRVVSYGPDRCPGGGDDIVVTGSVTDSQGTSKP